MIAAEFNEKYKSKGGMTKLATLRSMGFSRNYIAKEFGVTGPTVSEWMASMWMDDYDPNFDRKEFVIRTMVEFAAKHPIREFRKAFRIKNSPYYKEALEECYKSEIYEEK